MDFNFYEQYQTLSTAELLIIVGQQEGIYQPNAVEAAKSILDRRQVSEKDQKDAEIYFQNLADKQIQKQQRQVRLKSSAEDFFEPILRPGVELQPRKWLNLLLVAITVQYGWNFFLTVKEAIWFWNCTDCRFDFLTLTSYLTLLYVPVIFYLLYKKRRWGWILLFGDNLFCLLSEISQSYIFFKFQSIHHGSTAGFLFPVFLRTAFAYFLWRQDVAAFFSVTFKTKKETAVIATGISLVVIIGIMIAFS